MLYSIKDKLPKNNTYVLIHLTKDNWHDSNDQKGCLWKVAKFVRGISLETRKQMKAGFLKDKIIKTYNCPTPPGKWIEHEIKRSSLYESGDEEGNNKKPYCWESFGPAKYFGQEVDYWMELPKKELEERKILKCYQLQ